MASTPSTISELIGELPSSLEGMTPEEISVRARNGAHWDLVFAAIRREPDLFHDITALYCIAPVGDGFCKVGVTGNVPARLSALQSANWNKLELRAVIWHPSKRRAEAHERAFHLAAKERGCGVRGEWVQMDVDTAIAAVTRCAPNCFTDSSGLLLDWLPAIIRQEEGMGRLDSAAFRRPLAEKRGRGRPRGEGLREPNGRLSRAYKQVG